MPITETDIQGMSDRELDAAVAEHVMGFGWIHTDEVCGLVPNAAAWGEAAQGKGDKPREDRPNHCIPDYSTDPRRMVQVIEKMHDHVFYMHVLWNPDNVDERKSWVECWDNECPEEKYEASHASLPRAVATAALLAITHTEGK